MLHMNASQVWERIRLKLILINQQTGDRVKSTGCFWAKYCAPWRVIYAEGRKRHSERACRLVWKAVLRTEEREDGSRFGGRGTAVRQQAQHDEPGFIRAHRLPKFHPGPRPLKTIIPQLISIKAGINVNPKEAYHLALEVEVKDMADLEIYATHPEHLKVGKRIREILDSRSCVDYQI